MLAFVPKLDSVRSAGPRTLSIASRAIAADHFDSRMLGKPVAECLPLAVGQKVNRLASFEIDNHGAVSLTTAHRPVIHADNARRLLLKKCRASYRPQHRVAADGHRQTPRYSAAVLSSQRQTETLQHVAKPSGATTVGPGHGRETLCEYALGATG